VLVLLRSATAPPFTPEEIPRAELLAEAIAISHGTEQQRHDLEQLSRTDGLTLLPNYRSARELLQREIQRAQQLDEPFAIVLLNVSGLRSENARGGYLAGSDTLRRTGRALERNVRGSDSVAHLGGDEFLVFLPKAREEGALRAAERIAAALDVELAGARSLSGVKLGVACFPQNGTDFAGLLEAAVRNLSEPFGRRPPTEASISAPSSSVPDEESEGEDRAAA
jgi:diguanylate cyclase (GGDEF)-like protein